VSGPVFSVSYLCNQLVSCGFYLLFFLTP
jgi:hypothetical protein